MKKTTDGTGIKVAIPGRRGQMINVAARVVSYDPRTDKTTLRPCPPPDVDYRGGDITVNGEVKE